MTELIELAREALIHFLNNDARAAYDPEHAVKIVDLIDSLVRARVQDAMSALSGAVESNSAESVQTLSSSDDAE